MVVWDAVDGFTGFAVCWARIVFRRHDSCSPRTWRACYGWGVALMTSRNYLRTLAISFGVLWIVLAIKPWHRGDWVVENVLVALFIGLLVAMRRSFHFSLVSYTLFFVFSCLHILGAHYTYAEVPYDAWFQALTGRTFNSLAGWERNNFDRVVHFLYGFLLAYPVREIFLRVANVRGFWGYFLPLDLTVSTSGLYEIIEWGAAEVLGGELGAAYLGTQGDIWDAQKDMALASGGALLAMLVTAAINYRSQRDFAREWSESLRVKQHRPLGEQALRERSRGKQR